VSVRRRWIVVAAALTGALAPSPPVIASLPRAHVHLTPAHGGPDTTFVLSFVAPTTTGTTGSTQVRDLLSASNHPGAARCLGSVEFPIPAHRHGQHMRVYLDPSKLGRPWCPGVYRGEIQELMQPLCPQGEPCPAYVILRGTIARFELHVRG
jgi:hypothetical protein